VLNPPQNPVLDAIRKNLMVALDERKAALRAEGRRLFDFGLGDPREPTPGFVRDALRAAVPESSQYPSAMGTPALRRACAGWLGRRFGVQVDAERQIVPATGAKETVFHLPFAFAGGSARRKVVMPDPGYPTYEVGARFAGLEPVKVPLTAARTGSTTRTTPPAPPRRATTSSASPAPRGSTGSSWCPTSATATPTSPSRRPRCWSSRSRTCWRSSRSRSGAG
jgi:aspartate/methionine/tyrosine aminotransferase